MDKDSFNIMLNNFDNTSKLIQKKFTQIIAVLSSKKIPSTEDTDILNKQFAELRQNYNDAISAAKTLILDDMLPPEGSGLDRYTHAIKASAEVNAKRKIEQAITILSRFSKVRSDSSRYAQELKPYQDKSNILIKALSDHSKEFTNQTLAPELFLKAIDINDFNTEEEISLIQEIKKHFSDIVCYGLTGKKYYLDLSNTSNNMELSENLELNSPSSEAPNIILHSNNSAKDTNQELTLCNSSPSQNNSGTDNSHTSDSNTKCSSDVIPALTTDNISPSNKINTSDPNSSSFRKHS